MADETNPPREPEGNTETQQKDDKTDENPPADQNQPYGETGELVYSRTESGTTDETNPSREPESSSETQQGEHRTDAETPEVPNQTPAELETTSDVSEENLKAITEFLKEPILCSLHGKQLSHLCEKCDRYICISCAIEGDHRGHRVCEMGDEGQIPAKRQKLNKRIEQSREPIVAKMQENMELIKKKKGNVTQTCNDLSLKVETRTKELHKLLESWRQKQQSKINSQKQQELQTQDETLKNIQRCLMILEYPMCIADIDGSKCEYVLKMLESAIEQPEDLPTEDVLITEIGSAEKCFGAVQVFGIETEARHDKAAKMKFCDSDHDITQISPVNAKMAFVVMEKRLYLVDFVQRSCKRHNPEPLMENVEYITPVTERGIYVQKTGSNVIQSVTTDGKIQYFASFTSSHRLALSDTGMVLSWQFEPKGILGVLSWNRESRLALYEFDNNGIKQDSNVTEQCKYEDPTSNIIHTANGIWALKTYN
ncbi:uncharacterized protein [Argopecten irradians]